MNDKCCKGKIKYIEISSAQTCIERMAKLPKCKKDRSGTLGIYRCPICRCFHVGHKRHNLRPL